MDLDQVIKDLERKYKRIIGLPEKPFFVGLVAYVENVQGLQLKFVSELNRLGKENLTLDRKLIASIRNDLRTKSEETGLRAWKKYKLQFHNNEFNNIDAWQKITFVTHLFHVCTNSKKLEKLEKRIQVSSPKTSQFQEMINEVGAVLSNQEEKPRKWLVKNDYLNYLTIVHGFLITVLEHAKQKQISSIHFPQGQTVIYQNRQLLFKQGDGSFVSVSFANSPHLRPLFESFWEARKKKEPGTTIFDLKEIFEIYKQLHGKDYLGNFTDDLGNIRQLVYDKNKIPKDRFKINYHSEGKEIFCVR